ncbi:MAG: hypothetical protein HY422_01195 [Candidatus Komeilibacteria bacterium]|nr:hypothetical protein [Candidatus Komeilibacteria bacterium]
MSPVKYHKTRINALILFAILAGVLIFTPVSRVYAQAEVRDTPAFIQKIKEYIEKLREKSWFRASSKALEKAAEKFVNKLAQQTAEYIATGGRGKTSLQRRESFGAIIRKSGEAAIGDFLQDLSETTLLNELGLNICNPSAQLKLNISLQLLDEDNPQKLQNCNIREIQDNWQRLAGTVGVNYRLRQGDQIGFSSTITGPGGSGGQCVAPEGQCDFPGATNTYAGVCTEGSPVSGTSFSSQTFCTNDGDCIAIFGGKCTPYAVPCSSDAQCAVGGTTCKLAKGGGCGDDFDCPTGYKCIGGRGQSSGVPYFDLTKNFSSSEKLGFFGDLFSPQQSDLGGVLAVGSAARRAQELRQKYAELNAATCKGYKDVEYKTLGNDADYVQRTCDEIERLDQQSGDKSHTAKDTTLPAFSLGENSFWLNAATIFGRSLIAGLVKKYVRSGSFSLSQIGQGTDLDQVRQNIVQQLRTGNTSPLSFLNTQQVSNTLAESRGPALDTINKFEYISEFTICPDDRNNVGSENCTIDDNFASAINEKLTLSEAVADGTINADVPLISNLNVSVNSDPFCIRSGLCHSNIQRLRKYRVVPIGWEIAASLSPIEDPITLREAMNCYENNGLCKLDPQSNIYYHLIDPNWVLKAPETQCNAFSYGPKLIDIDVSERQQYCSDGVSCLAEDDSGNCIGGFGYCTKEKSVWRFAGTQCPQQYAGCAAYTKTVDQQSAAYLGNTVDLCDASQNGCRWFSKSQDNVGSVDSPVFAWNPNDRLYLNRQVQSCEADQVGCSQFLSLGTPGVNLIPNGDFDYFNANTATDFADPAWLDDSLTDSFDGWQGSPDTVFTTRDNAYYGSIGLKVHIPAGITGNRISTNAITGILADKTFTISWLGKSDADCTTDVSIASPATPAQSTTVSLTPQWKRYELTAKFDVNNLDTSLLLSFDTRCQLTSGVGVSDYYMDGVKLEFNNVASGFTTYGENGDVYGKSQFQCTKDDVGCDRFKPISGGASVPGRIDSDDQCPAECVGYQNYLELSSYFDALESAPAPAPAPLSENFIAATATQCPAAQVNCEEFTNLEEVAQGGEGKYYFNYVRQCVEDALGVTYYTLEGSDTAGYQVRTWRLLESNLASNQPCTNVDIGGKTCIDTAINTAATTCSAADLQSNLNCREFFDIAGDPHYVLQDRVIAASNDCQTYRRTTTGANFFVLKSESRTCQAQFNGCREYRGNQSGNVRTLFFDSFESGSIAPWDSNLSSISSQAVTTGGHSIANITPLGATSAQMKRSGQSLQVEANRELYMEFWMKNEVSATLTITPATGQSPLTLTVPVASDWQRYRVGPWYVASAFSAQPEINLGGPTPKIYLDNILLQQSISNSFLIKNSWKTPSSCDAPVPGAMLGCQTYIDSAGTSYNLRSFSKLCSEDVIGCRAFIDTKNSSDPFQRTYNENDPSEVTVPADSIFYFVYNQQNLCFESSKGCRALGSPQVNLDLPAAHPKYISGYTVETLINDPDTYDQTLCTDDGLFCEEYSTTQGSLVYFKQPLKRTCSYKENVNIAGQLFTGWFQTASLQAGATPIGCSDDGVLPFDSSDFKLYSNLSFEYNGWVGQCQDQYDRCTEFKDPLDTQGDNALKSANFSRPTDWSAFGQYGNSLVDAPGNGGPTDLFEVNSSLQYGSTRVDPKGTAVLSQTFTALDSTDVFSYSVDVNLRKMPDDPDPKIQANLTCYWESPLDEDYCTNGSTYDYSSPCSQGSATACPANYSCDQNSTLSLSYCNDTGNNTRTGIPCYTNTDCTNLDPGYTCEVFGQNQSDPNRDQKVLYIASAQTNKLNSWQTLQRSVDIGFDGNKKQLIKCDFELLQSRSVFNPARIRPGGGQCGSAPTFSGDELLPQCRDTYCVDPATGKADPAGAQTCVTDAACVTAPYTSCGGVSEVWWQNPSFKRAKGYYYLDDAQIDTVSCSGQVGKRDGCLLFLDVNNRSSKLFDTYATYQQSTNNNGSLVSPVVCDPSNTSCQNDSNRIIKVTRDRQCQEWLSCRSTTEVFDPSTGSYRQLCDQVGVCDQYTTGTQTLNCAHWVIPSTQRLEYGVYTNRSLAQNPVEYSGFSTYNNFDIGSLELVDVSTNGTNGPDAKNQDYRLVKVIDICDSTNSYEDPCGPVDPLDPSDKLGRCFAPNKCVVGIDGSHFSRTSDYVIKQTTRAWAEKDAPFPYSVIQTDTGDTKQVKFGFQKANICDSRYASCETRYYKFRYGSTSSITRYYSTDVNFQSVAIPSCLCQGGQQDGKECLSEDTEGALGCTQNLSIRCNLDSDCGKAKTNNKCVVTGDGTLSAEERCPDNGSPVYLKRAESFINLPGFCIEPDNRANINGSQDERACLTWLPIDNSPVGYDFYNQTREAGYTYKIPAYYCLEVGLYEKRTRYFIGEKCSDRCNKDDQKVDKDYKVEKQGRFGNYCHGFHLKTNCWAVPKGGSGLYPYDGDTVYNEQRPDGACIVLAQAVNERGDNAARTNLFWSDYNNGAGYKLGDRPFVTNPLTPAPPALKYKIGQDDTPFGSAVLTGLGFITDRLFIRNTKESPRVGSPLGCSDDAKKCAWFDQNSRTQFAVKGWTNPPFTGNEFYDIGLRRLKEIYAKIFNLYGWREGESCDYFVCGRTDDPFPGLTTGGYFGGQICDQLEPNACNASSDPTNPLATRCEPISNTCVNSFFTSKDPASSVYGICAACPVGFHTESRPEKRCESDPTALPFSDPAICDAYDFDPGSPIKTCADLGYACQQDPATTSASFRCYSGNFEGNDCKIPSDSAGAPLAAYVTCQYDAQTALSTCRYLGIDTGVECQSTADCTANDDGIEDNFIGELSAANKKSYCADSVKEGPHDFGTGSFCVGQPFTAGSTDPANNFDYNFDYNPVPCEAGATITNDLGEVISGPDICGSSTNAGFNGSCLPANEVRYKAVPPATEGAQFCVLEPTGYLPLCIKTATNPCTSVPYDRVIDTLAVPPPPGVLPLDETPKEDPAYSPYIIPAVCDSTGSNCKQIKKTGEFLVPGDNGFSVNNETGSASYLEGFQNFLVSLKFYMGADKNHLPIRYIDINWGDGLRQSRLGYYKNHMEQCIDPKVSATLGPRTGKQAPLEYAASPQACHESYRNYLHVYRYDIQYACGRCSISNAIECGRNEDCPGAESCQNQASSNASCYRPWVMVQDNWGWCTNNVYGEVGLGCNVPGNAGYVKFPGLIKVYKDPKP